MEIIYHPERITKPLINVGGRGSERFEAVSWDRALGLISERLLESRNRWGAESVVMGTGTMGGDQKDGRESRLPRIPRVRGLVGHEPRHILDGLGPRGEARVLDRAADE